MDCIIGAGRIGTCLAKLSQAHLLTREGDWQELGQLEGKDLAIVCTRNDDLDRVLEKAPQEALHRLCFVQNGMLSPWLKERGLEKNIRAILYFAVSAKGDEPNFGGESLVSGRQASLLVEKFKSWGVPAREVTPDQLQAVEMEKLIWNSIFGLLGELDQCSVGESLMNRSEELERLVKELIETAALEGISLDLSQTLKNLIAYSQSVSEYQARIKEWKWRNSWFFEIAKKHKRKNALWELLHQEINKP